MEQRLTNNNVDYIRVLIDKLEKTINRLDIQVESLTKQINVLTEKVNILIKEKQTLNTTDNIKTSLDEFNKQISTHQEQNIKTLNNSIDSLTKEFSKIKLSTPGTREIAPRIQTRNFLIYDVENYKKKINLQK